MNYKDEELFCLIQIYFLYEVNLYIKEEKVEG